MAVDWPPISGAVRPTPAEPGTEGEIYDRLRDVMLELRAISQAVDSRAGIYLNRGAWEVSHGLRAWLGGA